MSGGDEGSGRPQRGVALLVGSEAAQVLEHDERLPPHDHGEAGQQSLELRWREAVAERFDGLLEFRPVVGQPTWSEFPSSPALYEVVTEYASAPRG